MDEAAASAVAAPILGTAATDAGPPDELGTDGSILGSKEDEMSQENELTWAKAQVSDGSGGGI